MPQVLIGARAISYNVQRSSIARRKRIEVSPSGVQVIVPADASSDDIERFVRSRRRWLHDKTEEIREDARRLRGVTPQGVHSGAKVLFRGRYLKLRVLNEDVARPSLSYQSGFIAVLPRDIELIDHAPIVREMLNNWFDARLHQDALDIIRRRGIPHGLVPRGVRVKDQRTLWGSCGRDRIIRLDRKLARVPKPVFEYVVVHELSHLRYRDHSPAFWTLVKRALPDYTERKAWLEEHEVFVG